MAKQTFTVGQVLSAANMTSLQQTAMGGGSTSDKTTSYVLVAADAGTTVIMNAAGATTITVNTALFAAGDTVNIQNIGAGICTVTAGTATVNTAGSLALNQYEGGVLYFRSTSASTFFDYVQTGSVSPLTTKGDLYGFSTLDARIPIGTNNQVLTADSAQALGLKWATPSSGTTFHGASVYKSADQTLTTGTDTDLSWDTEFFDTDAFHSTVTNNSRFTIPSGYDGYYLVTASIWYAANSTSFRQTLIYKNGSSGGESYWAQFVFPTATQQTVTNLSAIYKLVATDFIQCRGRQDTGSGLAVQGTNTFSKFAITYLGA